MKSTRTISVSKLEFRYKREKGKDILQEIAIIPKKDAKIRTQHRRTTSKKIKVKRAVRGKTKRYNLNYKKINEVKNEKTKS